MAWRFELPDIRVVVDLVWPARTEGIIPNTKYEVDFHRRPRTKKKIHLPWALVMHAFITPTSQVRKLHLNRKRIKA